MENFILEEMTVEDIPEIYEKLHLKYVEKYYTEGKDEGFKNYETWYKFMLNSPYFKIYVVKKIEKSSELVSIIKFELDKNSATINIHTDENMRGRGFSYNFITKGIEKLLKERKIKYIDAYILKENEISKHLFEKLNFRYLKNSNHNGVRHMLYRLEIKKES